MNLGDNEYPVEQPKTQSPLPSLLHVMNIGDEYIYIYVHIYTNHKNKRAKEPKRIRTVEMKKTWDRLPGSGEIVLQGAEREGLADWVKYKRRLALKNNL